MAKNKFNFESGIKELETIVNSLERGEISLEDSIELFKEGMILSKECSKKLDEAEKKITILIEKEKGEFIEENFNMSEE